MNKENGISVVINTLNEEKNIQGCIESVSNIADEIIVCDMYSEDRTVEIAQSYGAKVVFHQRTGFVEPARLFAITQASHEWVLVLDADERLTEKLALRFQQAANENKNDIVTCWFLCWYFGNWAFYGGFFPGGWIRFFRKEIYIGAYSQSDETIHNGFNLLRDHPNQLHLGQEYYVEHYAYFTIERYITKTLGTYARIEAEQYHSKGRPFRLWSLILLPLKTFLGRYFLKSGYKDGVRGFILCVLFAGYIFAIWANLWLLEQQHVHHPMESKRE